MQRPESSHDWQLLESQVRQLVRQALSPALRRRLESSDIVQDVLMAVHRDGAAQDPERSANFLHWVAGVVRNRIRNLADYHGAQIRSLQREVSSDGVPPEPGAPDAEPISQLALHEEVRHLLEQLAALPEPERQLILLRDFEARSWDEVAELTGHPSPDAARVAHARLLVRLARDMNRGRGA